jgi:hypothetical protein
MDEGEESTVNGSVITEHLREEVSATDIVPEKNAPETPASVVAALMGAEFGSQVRADPRSSAAPHAPPPSPPTVSIRAPTAVTRTLKPAPRSSFEVTTPVGPKPSADRGDLERTPVLPIPKQPRLRSGIRVQEWLSWQRLPASDRIAFAGAVLAAISVLLPWKHSAQEGKVLGLLTLGFPLFLAALLWMGALLWRLSAQRRRNLPVVAWLIQLCAACFCVLWCFVFIKLTTYPASSGDPSFNVPSSHPLLGVYLALFASGVGLTGTLLGLREKPL